MKKITRQSRMRRMGINCVMAKSGGQDVNVTYARPMEPNDEKRWGRELSINLGSATIQLNGRGINAIKSVLRKVGEIN